MGLKNLLLKPLSGYPGGYKKMRRGTQGFNSTPPFQVPDNARDRRSRIPPLGFREYWYPALPAKDVKKNKPAMLRMLGTDVVFFKDKEGEVQALLDWCPHRAVYLSMGRCYFEGFLTCPYHGATFDGDGNCVAFLTEGPESMMVGAPGMKARKFPTVTLKGMVFVWMGEGEPVAPEEDIPPEMFEEHNICRPSFCMFDCNWGPCSRKHHGRSQRLHGAPQRLADPGQPRGRQTAHAPGLPRQPGQQQERALPARKRQVLGGKILLRRGWQDTLPDALPRRGRRVAAAPLALGLDLVL